MLVTERERTRLSVQQERGFSSVSASVLMQEDEKSLELWAGGLRELVTMKADISQYVLPADTVLLQGQVEELHSQWEELCLKVSKRGKREAVVEQGTGVRAHNAFTIRASGNEGERKHSPHIKERESLKRGLF